MKPLITAALLVPLSVHAVPQYYTFSGKIAGLSSNLLNDSAFQAAYPEYDYEADRAGSIDVSFVWKVDYDRQPSTGYADEPYIPFINGTWYSVNYFYIDFLGGSPFDAMIADNTNLQRERGVEPTFSWGEVYTKFASSGILIDAFGQNDYEPFEDVSEGDRVDLHMYLPLSTGFTLSVHDVLTVAEISDTNPLVVAKSVPGPDAVWIGLAGLAGLTFRAFRLS